MTIKDEATSKIQEYPSPDLGPKDYYDTDTYAITIFKWKESYKHSIKYINMVADSDMQLFALLYEQCLPEMHHYLKGTKGGNSIKLKQGGLEKLSYICKIMCNL